VEGGGSKNPSLGNYPLYTVVDFLYIIVCYVFSGI